MGEYGVCTPSPGPTLDCESMPECARCGVCGGGIEDEEDEPFEVDSLIGVASLLSLPLARGLIGAGTGLAPRGAPTDAGERWNEANGGRLA